MPARNTPKPIEPQGGTDPQIESIPADIARPEAGAPQGVAPRNYEDGYWDRVAARKAERDARAAAMAVRNHADLKALAALARRPEGTLTVLSSGNDPFCADQPARRARAEWFASLWTEHEFRHGVHLRKVHYLLLSREARMADGAPYENTLETWHELGSAGRDARYLQLVPQNSFVDRRTGLPEINTVEEQDAFFSILGNHRFDGNLPDKLPGLPRINIEAPIVRQPYLVEIWVEKTTQNDILSPLARRYQCNLVPGAGEQSVTRCDEFIDRVIADGRPARIIYISDFDPGGQSMPAAVARKIEYRVHRDDLDVDIQVRPIALTLEQVIEYNLPSTPIKASERRGDKFRKRFEREATELDALEALHPGLLQGIVIEELDRYFDHGLANAVTTIAADLQAEANSISRSVAAEHAAAMDELNQEYRLAKAAFDSVLVGLEFARQAIVETVMDQLTAEAEKLADEADWPKPDAGDDDANPLFSSRRSYVTQCDRFKQHQGERTQGKIAEREAREVEAAEARRARAAALRAGRSVR